MGMKAHRFVGLEKDVWLPDDITVKIDIVPASRTNIRSNQRSTAQTTTTWHDTGNPNSDANGERNWLHSGAGGASVGYNFAFGDKLIIQLTPLNEVTWAAGTATGNRTSWHAEQCLRVASWENTLKTGAALHGGLCAAKGWDVTKALVQHNVWYGKNCPGQIRKRGEWPKVMNLTVQAANLARQAAAGGSLPPLVTTTPAPGYAKPSPVIGLDDTDVSKGDTAPAVTTVDGVDYVFVYDLVEATKATPRLRFASSEERIGPDIPKGTQFIVAWMFTYEGEQFYLTPWATRVRVADTKRIQDAVKEGAN